MGTDTYKITDIAQAAFLFASGTNLISIDRQNPRRCIFIFNLPRQDLILKWQEGRATVNALAYHNSYQSLKAKMFRGEV